MASKISIFYIVKYGNRGILKMYYSNRVLYDNKFEFLT